MIKKTVYTLAVDNYAPEICALTHPLIDRYAAKIGASRVNITTRRWPEFPPVYEKLQIYELAQRRDDDYIVYIDSDALVHPDLFDVTAYVPANTVMHNATDVAGKRFVPDAYMLRDGRFIGSANWFAVASSWCLDLWHPLIDLTLREAVARIHPTQDEAKAGIEAAHLIDDFVLTRNVARYGLRVMTLQRLLQDTGEATRSTFYPLWHAYLMSREQKLTELRRVLQSWGLDQGATEGG